MGHLFCEHQVKKINIEIADTPDMLSKGLMFRKSLDENSGMLFKFPCATYASFWGKNTYIPLDIAFIKDNKVSEIKEIAPFSTKTVYSNFPCQYAVEVNAGFFKKNEIKEGTEIEFEKDNLIFKC